MPRSNRSWWEWRPCRSSPPRPRRVRCCASSTTHTGWTPPRPGRCSSAPTGSARTAWPSSFASRDGIWGSFDPQGLPELEVGGLDVDASRSLLQDRFGDGTLADVVERLVVETRGNPLALLELPAELTPDQLSGVEPLPSQLHLTARVERLFLDRAASLPPPVQTVLLLAAADDTGDVEVVRRAAAALDLADADVQAAADSGLLVLDTTSLSLRHPLVRSALYQAATAARTREVHGALATALSGHGIPTGRSGTARRQQQGPTLSGGGAGAGRHPRPEAGRERRGPGGVRTRGHAVRRPGAAHRADRGGGAERLGLRPGQPCAGAAGECTRGRPRPRAAGRRRAASWTHRGQPRLGVRGALDLRRGAQAVHPTDPARALDFALPPPSCAPSGQHGTPMASVVFAHHQADDSPTSCLRPVERRGHIYEVTGPRPQPHWTWPSSSASGSTTGRALEPRKRRVAARRRRRPAALLRFRTLTSP